MLTQEEFQRRAAEFRHEFDSLAREIGKTIVGMPEVVEGVLMCLFAGGHVLLEGVPGLGKTMLVRTLSQVLDMPFSRIQFTPDLMPADIVGTNIIQEDPETGRRHFLFERGPVFANLVLADEINRATPKTQSAMLEAMQESSVTVAGKSYQLDRPFFVLATQNPLEMEGTYPLPEAQLDRFLFKMLVRFPDRAELGEILNRTTTSETPASERIMNGERVMVWREFIRSIAMAPHVQDYAVRLVLATHPESEFAVETVKRYVRYGSSPRGAQALILCGKIRALCQERYNVAFSDIAAVAPAALRHRLILNFEGEAEGVATDSIIQRIVETIPKESAVATAS